jgi:hypothetical protein
MPLATGYPLTALAGRPIRYTRGVEYLDENDLNIYRSSAWRHRNPVRHRG